MRTGPDKMRLPPGKLPVYAHGVTMVEVLIVIVIIGIMMALAAPSMRAVAARSEIKTATDNVVQAIRMAKNKARVTNRPVTVTFTTGDTGNSISFQFPGQETMALATPNIDLPANITVEAAPATFQFGPMGTIVGFNQASSIILTSTLKSSETATIKIVNSMGYVTVPDPEA